MSRRILRDGAWLVGCCVLMANAAIAQTTVPGAQSATGGQPKTVKIGSGSGVLDYPTAQETLKLQPGDTLYIAAGTYSGFTLANLKGTAEAPIVVRADPQAVFTNPKGWNGRFANVSFVQFRDLKFVNYAGRAFCFSGDSHDVLFENLKVTDGVNYFFYIYDGSKVFDGTRASTFYNFKWENCSFDGITSGVAISTQNYDPIGALKSVSLDFEVSHCTFRRLEGMCLEMSNSYNLQVHDCSFSDIGPLSAGGHSACIGGSGYYKVYRNTFTRHWGDDVRMFPAKLAALGHDGPDAVCRYYNNISYEKRKYAAYEHNQLSQADIDRSRGYLSKAPSEVYFNTFYRSRKVDYVAPLVDVYGPNITIKHNLVIEPECDAAFDPKRNYVYQLGAGQQPGVVVSNNLVFQTFAMSGLVDAVKFVPSPTSPALNAADGDVSYIKVDHDGKDRRAGPAADLGAVERQ